MISSEFHEISSGWYFGLKVHPPALRPKRSRLRRWSRWGSPTVTPAPPRRWRAGVVLMPSRTATACVSLRGTGGDRTHHPDPSVRLGRRRDAQNLHVQRHPGDLLDADEKCAPPQGLRRTALFIEERVPARAIRVSVVGSAVDRRAGDAGDPVRRALQVGRGDEILRQGVLQHGVAESRCDAVPDGAAVHPGHRVVGAVRQPAGGVPGGLDRVTSRKRVGGQAVAVPVQQTGSMTSPGSPLPRWGVIEAPSFNSRFALALHEC